MRQCDVLVELALIGHQYQHAFFIGALFKRIDFGNGRCIGCIAANTPDGIGRIEY